VSHLEELRKLAKGPPSLKLRCELSEKSELSPATTPLNSLNSLNSQANTVTHTASPEGRRVVFPPIPRRCVVCRAVRMSVVAVRDTCGACVLAAIGAVEKKEASS
jgi:hypothetical protein